MSPRALVASFAIPRRPVAGGALACAVGATFLFAALRAVPKTELQEATAWGVVVLAAFAGWGALVHALVLGERRSDLGLRMAWGASATLFAGGLAGALGVMSRGLVHLLVDVGVALAMLDALRSSDALARSGRLAVRAARRQPLLAVTLAAALGCAAVTFVAAAADTTYNPYDDDVAYTPFVKKWLETGSLLEPFSFRRMSALGGQTFFHALLWPHVVPRGLNLFDRGVAVVMIVALVLGHRDGARRLSPLAALFALALLLFLKNTSINVAGHYSGVVFFLALYRTLVWLPERVSPARAGLLVALVAAAACTIRQSFVVVPAVVVVASGASYALAERRELVRRGRETVAVGVATLVLLLPWFVHSYRSNHAFLFPLQMGTYRASLQMTSIAAGPLTELRLLASTCLENEPVRVLPILVVAAALLPDRGARRPLRSMWIGCGLGVVALAHSFTVADPINLGRYMFGYATAFALAVILRAGTLAPRELGGAGSWPRVAQGLVLVALVLQLDHGRKDASKHYDGLVRTLREATGRARRSDAMLPPELGMYAALQSAVPAGERMLVMLDEPYHLDFGRNPILNFDMPGYSSPRPGMPYFQGPEAVADYLRALRIRYLAFVRPDASHALYKRDVWFRRMLNEEEYWRAASPYFIDFFDTLDALARSRARLFDRDGMIVLDLETRAAPSDTTVR